MGLLLAGATTDGNRSGKESGHSHDGQWRLAARPARDIPESWPMYSGDMSSIPRCTSFAALGQRVPLEPQAFDVLADLVQHRERVGGWHCCGIWRWASIEWSICKGILGWRSPRSART